MQIYVKYVYIPNESLLRSVIAYSPGSCRALIPPRLASPRQLRYRVVTSNKTQRGHIYAVFCLSLSLWLARARPVTRLAVSELSSVFTLHSAQYTWPAYLCSPVCHTLASLTLTCMHQPDVSKHFSSLAPLSTPVSQARKHRRISVHLSRLTASPEILWRSEKLRASEISLVIELSLDTEELAWVMSRNDSEPSQSIMI